MLDMKIDGKNQLLNVQSQIFHACSGRWLKKNYTRKYRSDLVKVPLSINNIFPPFIFLSSVHFDTVFFFLSNMKEICYEDLTYVKVSCHGSTDFELRTKIILHVVYIFMWDKTTHLSDEVTPQKYQATCM